jgi:hypothetical protein
MFYQAREVPTDIINCQLRLILDSNEDDCRYNLPSLNEGLAGFVPDIPVEYGARSYCDIYLYLCRVR